MTREQNTIKQMIESLEDCKSYLVACRNYEINQYGAIDAQIEDAQKAIDAAKLELGMYVVRFWF